MSLLLPTDPRSFPTAVGGTVLNLSYASTMHRCHSCPSAVRCASCEWEWDGPWVDLLNKKCQDTHQNRDFNHFGTIIIVTFQNPVECFCISKQASEQLFDCCYLHQPTEISSIIVKHQYDLDVIPTVSFHDATSKFSDILKSRRARSVRIIQDKKTKLKGFGLGENPSSSSKDPWLFLWKHATWNKHVAALSWNCICSKSLELGRWLVVASLNISRWIFPKIFLPVSSHDNQHVLCPFWAGSSWTNVPWLVYRETLWKVRLMLLLVTKKTVLSIL